MLSGLPAGNIISMASSVAPSSIDLWRRSTDRVFAGVAGGLADRFGLPAAYVRAGFVITAVLWGLGLVVYVSLWIATFERTADREVAELAESQQVGAGLVFMGAVVGLRSVGMWPNDVLVLMVATIAFGMAALSGFDWLARILEPETASPSKLRVVAGSLLLLVGLGLLAGALSQVPTLGTATTAVVVTALGVIVAFGPWLVGMGRALTAERSERIRQEERAEMATHLHDSVLQTLALMQRTDDPKRMTTLARQQERELRSWLYGSPGADDDSTLGAALKNLGARVETDFSIPIEVITVGDASNEVVGKALLAAAREAMVNAAKHSGAGEVSVYAEFANGRADVWIADLGTGFDPDAVGDDRRGLSDSIRGRMARAGGGAAIETEPGEGTEVHLWANINGGGAG